MVSSLALGTGGPALQSVLCEAHGDANARHARGNGAPLTVTCHNATLVIPDWTEPLPRRSAMGVALSADGAPGRPTGRCMEVAGRRRSARMTGKAVPQPSGGVGDATLPARGLPGTAKGGWRASMGLSRRIQDDRTPPPGAGEVNGLHVPVVASGTPPQRATGQRLIAIPIVSGARAGLRCRWWRA